MATESARDDRPRKKKKKKKSSAGLWIGLGVGGGVLLVILIVTVVVVVVQRSRERGDPRPAPQAKVDEKDNKNDAVRIAPRIDEGNPAKKGGKDIVQNIRGAVYRAERRNELANLRTSYVQFSDDFKGAARTYENFLEYIKTFGPIRDAVKEGYYKMNMKARLDGDNIIAYERDEDATGHLCVRANGELGYVPAAQLKKELGIQ